MNCYKNLYILGTSHISKDSVDLVEKFITKERPDIVAVELDNKRLYAMMSNAKPSFKEVFSIGIKAFLINIVGAYAEKKLGSIVGVKPGSEMRKAVELVKENKLKLSLIDQDISITLKKLSKAITFRVIFRFLGDIIKSVFSKKKEFIAFDMRKVPYKEVIEKLIEKIKDRYYEIYKVLIEERNEVMAKNLYKLINKYNDKRIFAVVGAGHEFEIVSIIKRIEA